LHDGEIEVMILGKEMKADLLIIDDNVAREYAKYLEFSITGTLGVLLQAKEKVYIESVKPLIDALIGNDIYIGESIYKYVLTIAGEY
jgi:predicted nucleic acid-binding protein